MRSEAVICFLLLMALLGTTADPWLASGLLFVHVQKLRQLCLVPPRVLERSVIGCWSWRLTSAWWLCHFDVSGRHMGDLQMVEGDPFGPGANLEVKPLVSPCDDSIRPV